MLSKASGINHISHRGIRRPQARFPNLVKFLIYINELKFPETMTTGDVIEMFWVGIEKELGGCEARWMHGGGWWEARMQGRTGEEDMGEKEGQGLTGG